MTIFQQMFYIILFRINISNNADHNTNNKQRTQSSGKQWS